MIRVPIAWLDWFDLRRSIAWIAVIGGGYAFAVWRTYEHGGSPFGVLCAAPLVAFALAPAIVALLPGYVRWVDERVWTPWQGIYHAFDDHQIRVVEARGALWFASDDVHAALRLKRRDGVLRALRTAERRDDPDVGEVLSNNGLVKLLGRSTDRDTLRFLAWADGVRRVWQKRRDATPRATADGAPAAAARSTEPPPRDERRP